MFLDFKSRSQALHSHTARVAHSRALSEMLYPDPNGTASMIIGFGNDLCDIRRIEDSLARFGERFVLRCFTETERQKSDARAGRAASYAKRFAAKEACAKALGTGFRAGVAFRDMGVVNLPSGKPTLSLTGGAAARLEALTPPGHEVFIHLTLTDEYPLAQAQVIIEAVAIAASNPASNP